MAQETSGQSPLLQAAAKGDLETVKILTEAGDDPNARNDLGQTPLHWAVGGGYANVASALLKAGADPGARDDHGQTPLHVAAGKGELEIVKILINAGADPYAKNNEGLTSRQWAVRNGHENTASSPLLDKETNSNTVNNFNQTSPDTAVLQNSQVSTHLDLSVVTAKTTPTKSNKALIAEATSRLILDSANDSKFSEIVIERDSAESSWPVSQKLLHRAIFEGHTELVKALIEEGTRCDKMPEVPSYYLRTFCQLQLKDCNFLRKISMSPLHCAALAGYIDIVNILIPVSEDVLNKGTKDLSWSPLHCAARKNHADIASALIQAGADLESKDSGGETPLCLALRHCNEKVANVLIQEGADINAMPHVECRCP